MLSSSEIKPFDLILENYKTGESSKEHTLSKLEEKYQSVRRKNEQKMTDILEKHRFYRFVPCSADRLITVYDKTLNSTSDSERKELEKTIHKILSVVPVEFMGEFEGNDADHLASIAVYQERDEIAELYQKNREIAVLYEKYKAEIENIQDAESANEPPPAIQAMIGVVLKKEKDENEKYLPEDGQKDRQIIKWIFDNSGYQDEITPEIYYKYVSTKCKQGSIERYFSEAKNEAK
jgi:hypothetical protein